MRWVFLPDIKRGARFGGKLAVSVDGGLREPGTQISDKPYESFALCRSAGVGGVHSGVASADVAHAYGVGVVSCAVGTRLIDRTTRLYGTIEIHYIMVAYGSEAACAMPAVDVGYGNMSTGRSSRAVDDDFGDVSHSVWMIKIQYAQRYSRHVWRS